MGPSQLWTDCPFVAVLNLRGQPSQSAPFLLTFSSALIGGRSVTNPSHHEISKGGGVCDRDAAGIFLQGAGLEVGMGRGSGKIGAGGICCL